MPFEIIQGDITRIQADAIVNAANPQLQMGGGVCGAIFMAAGPQKLQAACDKLAPIHTGEAVITPGFALPARFVIHTAGPVYSRQSPDESERLLASAYRSSLKLAFEAVITPGFALPARFVIHTAGPVYSRQSPDESERLLASAYRSSLKLAFEHGCHSIAFPLISSGIYGYPRRDALEVATCAIRGFLEIHDMDVKLVIFNRSDVQIPPGTSSGIYGYPRRDALEVATCAIRGFLEIHDMDVKLVIFNRSDVQIPPGTLSSVDDWLKKRLPETQAVRSLSDTIAMDRLCESTLLQPSAAPASPFHPDFSTMFGKLDEPFDVYLMKLIDRRGMNDVQVYRRANLDRRLFSKIRSGKGYHPGKRDEPFDVYLMKLIDRRGMNDVQVYRRANLDRRLFSKIRSGKGYHPGKRAILALAVALKLTLEETEALLERAGYALSPADKFDVVMEYFLEHGPRDTILALAVALKLTLEETEALLERAGYALSPADKFDVVMEYFLEHGPRDIDEINEVLFYYGLPLLGGS